MQKIIPNIWCQGNADEVAEYYVDIFSHTPQEAHIQETITYSEEGLQEFQESLAGKTLTVEVELSGTRFILINAGVEFRPNPFLSFVLNFDPILEPEAKAHLEQMWQLLSSTGKVLMPLDSYPFSPYFAWVEDPYEVSSQLHLAPEGSDPRSFIIPSFMFGAEAQNQAKAAQRSTSALFQIPNWAAPWSLPKQLDLLKRAH
ncbi:VOC family protein [Corynebacterium callunae]|uniref:VOC family protein n=1 Tax=Corynebacterium callunae TaxID=1721 RepID=UPI0039823053